MVKDKEHKVNIKARIDRHSRMIKANITLHNKLLSVLKKNNLGYKIVIWFMVFAMPIYPMFAWIVHNANEYEFYRWYIDESSILWSYYQEKTSVIWDSLVESTDEFMVDNTVLHEDRNYDGTNEIRSYIVKNWDSISVIASKFEVTKDTIYEFNNFSKTHTIRPGEELKIPSTSWTPYKVKSGDTLLAIAIKYEIEKEDILEFNDFKEGQSLKIGEEIFLPGAKKIIVKPKYVAPKKTYTKSVATNTNYVASQYTNSKWVYPLVWRSPYSGAWWNCTYYVASYKNVNWRWNANQWIRNAAAKWNKVVYGRWFAPKLWAIVVLEWRGYNLRYGHVAIVMEVKSDYMIVSDMNYRKLNEVTYRKVSLSSKNITGYIYVN